MRISIILYFIFGIIFNTVSQVTITKEIEQKIESLVDKRINNKTPGVIIGVFQNGKLIFNRNYGLANMTYSIPNSTKILCNLGSVSKQFVGYAFAILHEQGKINLDDPVSKYLKNWPRFEYEVTLRHLLSHTSGYRDAYTISNLAGRTIGKDYFSREECLNVIRNQKKLEFEPGTRFVYNSSTWIILTEILELTTRNLANDWIKTNIFNPLNMNDTTIETYVGEVIENAAESYIYDEKETGYVNIKGNRAIFGAADIYSNINDIIKWMENFETGKLGGKKVQELFFNPFILKNGFNTNYGLGIYVNPFYGLKRYKHIGLHEGFHSDIAYFPEHKLGIVTISNFGLIGEVSTSSIAKILLKKHLRTNKEKSHPNFKFNIDDYKDFNGLYINTNFNKKINLNVKKDSLFINGKARLIPVAKNTFKIKGLQKLNIIINKDENNIPQVIAQEKAKRYYKKVTSWNPDLEELKEFVGNYWSEEVGANYEITLKNNNLIIKSRWLKNIKLFPLTKDVFDTSSKYFIQITRNKKGEICGFNINTRRSLNIHFKKIKLVDQS